MKGLLPTLVALPLLASCGTIDQVPLVYVSTVKVGVNAETGTTASPGGKVVIGVDATDAAYVPIAVARRCDEKNLGSCPKGTFPLDLVKGGNSFNVAEFILAARTMTEQVSQTAELINVAQGQLATAIQQESEAEVQSVRLKAAEVAKTEQEQALARRPAINADGTAIRLSAAADDPLIQFFTKQIDLDKGAHDKLEQARKRTLMARAALDGKMTDFANAQIALSQSLARTPDATGTREDALSVFGSFDTKARGGASDGAGIALGKSFSTGVAAQLLTEGLSRASSAAAVSKCLMSVQDAAKDVSTPAERDKAITYGIKACQTGRFQ